MALTDGFRVGSELMGQVKNGWAVGAISDDQIEFRKGGFGIYFNNQEQAKAFLIGLECAYLDMEK